MRLHQCRHPAHNVSFLPSLIWNYKSKTKITCNESLFYGKNIKKNQQLQPYLGVLYMLSTGWYNQILQNN